MELRTASSKTLVCLYSTVDVSVVCCTKTKSQWFHKPTKPNFHGRMVPAYIRIPTRPADHDDAANIAAHYNCGGAAMRMRHERRWSSNSDCKCPPTVPWRPSDVPSNDCCMPKDLPVIAMPRRGVCGTRSTPTRFLAQRSSRNGSQDAPRMPKRTKSISQ